MIFTIVVLVIVCAAFVIVDESETVPGNILPCEVDEP